MENGEKMGEKAEKVVGKWEKLRENVEDEEKCRDGQNVVGVDENDGEV